MPCLMFVMVVVGFLFLDCVKIFQILEICSPKEKTRENSG